MLAGRECWRLVTTPLPRTTELKLNLQSLSSVPPSLGITAPPTPASTNFTLTSSWNPAREKGEAEGEAEAAEENTTSMSGPELVTCTQKSQIVFSVKAFFGSDRSPRSADVRPYVRFKFV